MSTTVSADYVRMKSLRPVAAVGRHRMSCEEQTPRSGWMRRWPRLHRQLARHATDRALKLRPFGTRGRSLPQVAHRGRGYSGMPQPQPILAAQFVLVATTAGRKPAGAMTSAGDLRTASEIRACSRIPDFARQPSADPAQDAGPAPRFAFCRPCWRCGRHAAASGASRRLTGRRRSRLDRAGGDVYQTGPGLRPRRQVGPLPGRRLRRSAKTRAAARFVVVAPRRRRVTGRPDVRGTVQQAERGLRQAAPPRRADRGRRARRPCARSASPCSRPTSPCRWCKDFITKVRERAVGAGGAPLASRPASRSSRSSTTPGRGARRRRGRYRRPWPRPQRAVAGADPDGRPAGLGQDHHLRQDRAAAAEPRQEEGAAGLARRAPPGGAAAAARRWRSRRASPACRSSPARRRWRSPSAPWTSARRELFDVVILDTAGRLPIDEALMAEVAAVKAATNPHETLLVVDAMTGQDAVNTATRLPGHGRRHRHRPDPDRRRCPRRRGAVHARGHRRADQAARRRREAGRAGGFPPRPHRRPHPRHGRHRLAWSSARPRPSTRPRPRSSRPGCRRASSTWRTTPAS